MIRECVIGFRFLYIEMAKQFKYANDRESVFTIEIGFLVGSILKANMKDKCIRNKQVGISWLWRSQNFSSSSPSLGFIMKFTVIAYRFHYESNKRIDPNHRTFGGKKPW